MSCSITVPLSLPLRTCRRALGSRSLYVMRGATPPAFDESSTTINHRSTRTPAGSYQSYCTHFSASRGKSLTSHSSSIHHARRDYRTYSTQLPNMDTIKNTIAENFGGDAAASLGTHQFSLDATPDLSNKVAVVTGGSEGIGYGVTHTLLKHNIAKLFILSVSKEVVDGAKASIAKDLGQEAADRTVWYHCDLTDWKQTKDVAEQIKKNTDRLDILVNNAGRGIMTYQLTDYGVDRHMALNHMGHVVLTSHLLPLMKKTAESGNTVRIANQASNAHQASPSDTKFESLEELNQDLGPNGQYGRSKLASILYARYFNRKVTQNGHPNVLMNASHPGFVSTKMSKEDIHEPYPLGGYAMSVGLEPFKKDQFEGAVSIVYAATAIKESGQYICPPAVPEPGSKLAQDDELADRLMELTRKVVTEKTKSESTQQGCPMDDLVLH